MLQSHSKTWVKYLQYSLTTITRFSALLELKAYLFNHSWVSIPLTQCLYFVNNTLYPVGSQLTLAGKCSFLLHTHITVSHLHAYMCTCKLDLSKYIVSLGKDLDVFQQSNYGKIIKILFHFLKCVCSITFIFAKSETRQWTTCTCPLITF